MLLLLLSVLTLSAAPPPRPELGFLVESRIETREFHVVIDVPETGPAKVLAVFDLNANPSATLKAILNFPARKKDIAGIRSVEVNRSSDGTEIHVRTEREVMGIQSLQHEVFTVDQAAGWVQFGPDPRARSTVQTLTGWFEVVPISGGCRVFYRGEGLEDQLRPVWARAEYLEGELKPLIEGIRRRAEDG
jgi:hypothetical protein